MASSLLCVSLPATTNTGTTKIREVPVVYTEPSQALGILKNLEFPQDVAVNFTQQQLNPLIKNVSEQRGTMTKSTNDGLVMRVTQPRFEERILRNGEITLKRKKVRTNQGLPGMLVRRLQLDPERPSHLVLLALEALLYGNFTDLQNHFSLTAATSQADTWQIVLEPIDEKVRKQLSELHFYGQANQLTRFRSQRVNSAGHISHWLDVHIEPPT